MHTNINAQYFEYFTANVSFNFYVRRYFTGMVVLVVVLHEAFEELDLVSDWASFVCLFCAAIGRLRCRRVEIFAAVKLVEDVLLVDLGRAALHTRVHVRTVCKERISRASLLACRGNLGRFSY